MDHGQAAPAYRVDIRVSPHRHAERLVMNLDQQPRSVRQ
jgi:hypothetical protein